MGAANHPCHFSEKVAEAERKQVQAAEAAAREVAKKKQQFEVLLMLFYIIGCLLWALLGQAASTHTHTRTLTTADLPNRLTLRRSATSARR